MIFSLRLTPGKTRQKIALGRSEPFSFFLKKKNLFSTVLPRQCPGRGGGRREGGVKQKLGPFFLRVLRARRYYSVAGPSISGAPKHSSTTFIHVYICCCCCCCKRGRPDFPNSSAAHPNPPIPTWPYTLNPPTIHSSPNPS